MKIILKFVGLLALLVNFSCNYSEEKKNENLPVPESKIMVQDTQLVIQDTIHAKAIIDTIEKEWKLDQKKNSSKTKAWLKQPFDFFKFKKAVRGANTTTSYNYKNFFKPNHKGFFFTFFVFQGCHPRGLQISVYKKGSQMGNFSDKDQTVVCIESKCELKALGGLNLVGKPLSYLEETIGKNYIKNNYEVLFAEKGTFLLVSLSSRSIVRNFKYIKTKLKRIESFDEISRM